MTTTAPNPLLIAKVERFLLDILSGPTFRSSVEGAVGTLVLEELHNVPADVRLRLLDEHMACVRWLMDEALLDDPEPTYTHKVED